MLAFHVIGFKMMKLGVVVSLFDLFKISNVMPLTIKELLFCWNSRGISKQLKKIWSTIPACICGSIWKGRNGKCFEGKSFSVQQLRSNCLGLFAFWCNLHDVRNEDCMSDFIDSLQA